MYLIQILLPVKDNSGQPLASRVMPGANIGKKPNPAVRRSDSGNFRCAKARCDPHDRQRNQKTQIAVAQVRYTPVCCPS